MARRVVGAAPPLGEGELSVSLAAGALYLARRFAAGGRMWCLAPEWPAHAHHLAVEFVHPVVVGKRALPAAVVEQRRAVEDLRLLARPGDVLVAVSSRHDPTVTAVTRRAPAWGVGTFWIGAGERPPPGAADYVLFLPDEEGTAPFSGRLVRTYHLLWELTHVCFEHPGLLAGTSHGDEASCVTCSDEGRLGEVVDVADDGVAIVRSARGLETVDSALVDGAAPGDLVLIHAGSLVSIVEGVSP